MLIQLNHKTFNPAFTDVSKQSNSMRYQGLDPKTPPPEIPLIFNPLFLHRLQTPQQETIQNHSDFPNHPINPYARKALEAYKNDIPILDYLQLQQPATRATIGLQALPVAIAFILAISMISSSAPYLHHLTMPFLKRALEARDTKIVLTRSSQQAKTSI
jgi:hypothetical protein